jgi:hypothetical protein
MKIIPVTRRDVSRDMGVVHVPNAPDLISLSSFLFMLRRRLGDHAHHVTYPRVLAHGSVVRGRVGALTFGHADAKQGSVAVAK